MPWTTWAEGTQTGIPDTTQNPLYVLNHGQQFQEL
jgi:hypothetical protein